MVTKLLGGLFALRFRDRWFEALAEHGPAVALLALGSALICIGVMRRVR